MRILQIHNHYQQAGGEDMVVHAERSLLESHGDEVDVFEEDNAAIAGIVAKVKAAITTIYSPEARQRLAARISSFQPDVVHVHNFFPLLSPSIYWACGEAGVPVVQTLHNYRLICPNALLLRSGRPCKDCTGKGFAWPGVLHGCYRRSHLGTASIAAMTSAHHWIGTWRTRVGAYIALSEFAKKNLVEGGLPLEKIAVKPNFVREPGNRVHGYGRFALFVGRLSQEKGIKTLLSAWDRVGDAIPLKVAGDGPLKEEVISCAAEGRIEYLGKRPHAEILQLMKEAAFLVFPSVCYENFPLAIGEAFACGLPVLASQIGAMGEVIGHGCTGLHFRPGDADDLAAKVEWAVAHPKEMARMRRAARTEYEAKYTPERNYALLMEIYRHVADVKSAAKYWPSHAEVAR